MQKIAKKVAFDISCIESCEEKIETEVEAFIKPFDLSQAPLLRVGLIGLSPEKHVLVFDIHHIISDGISINLLIKDLMVLYNGGELPALPLQYKDYAEWQQSPAHQESLAGHRAFWLNEFAEEVTKVTLPADYPRPRVKSIAGGLVSFGLNKDETNALKEVGLNDGATLYMVLLSVFKVLLSRLGNQEDLVVGTPVAGRQHADLENLIGVFVNSVAIRSKAQGELSFRQYVQQVKAKALACFEHQSYQLEDLVDALGLERDTSRNPLFDVMFVLQNFEEKQLTLPGLTLAPYQRAHETAQFDLTLRAVESGEEILLDLEYCTALFKPQTVERLAAYLRRVVAAVIADPEQKLAQIEILSEAEKHQLLVAFNDTEADYPREQTIIDLFEQQARSRPHQPALLCGGESMSYQQFQNRVDTLAAHLLEEGIQPGDVVGVFYERSFELLVSLYAVMKAGGVYLPLEGTYPPERLAFLLRDSGVCLLLGPAQAAGRLAGTVPVVDLPVVDLSALSWGQPAARPQSKARPGGLAYCIYTSGSTGRPKGVMIQHNSLLNRIHWMQRHCPIGVGDVVLQKTPKAFDVSLWELVWWSQTGSVLCLLGPGEEKDPQKLTESIKANGVSVLHFVPSMLQVYLDYLEATHSEQEVETLRWVFCSGEALPAHQVNRFNGLLRAAHATKLVNLYGPTEATIDVSYFDCYHQQDYRQVPIGKPIDNTWLYVLDAQRRLQPVGVAGELYIGGLAVGRGYVNNQALSRERFVADPYRPGERLYRTGDLARVQADGNTEYLGRLDHQVKLRGYRIELGEIEHHLLTYPGVGQAVALAREADTDKADKYLVAYYVADEAIADSTLRTFLAQHLPDYMVPAHLVHLAVMPLTANGKIDRKALPEPELGAAAEYVAPASELEEQLAALWSQVLALPKEAISATRSFFELGGHSLKAIGLVNKLGKALHVELPLKKVFEYQSIRELGRYLEGLERQTYCPINPAPEQPYYRVSSAQKRMYFLYAFDPSSTAYNMSHVLRLEGVLDRQRLTHAFYQLICRHESLRTSFELAAGVPVQKIAGESDFQVSYAAATQEQLPAAIEAFIRPFDLSQAPLLRVGLLRVSAQEHVLLVDMHHIISDGVSLGLLIKDFMALYRGEALPPLSLQYKDYAEWQQSPAHQERLAGHGAYWLEAFAQPVSLLELPTDYARPPVKTHAGAVLRFRLSRQETGGLWALAEKEGATLFMVLLSVFKVLLRRLGNQEDLVVGTPVAGRGHADLEDIIGMFVNSVAIRSQANGSLSFRAFLHAVKKKTLACFEHQSYQFESLIDALAIARDPSRNPLFDVVFVLQNFEERQLELPDLTLTPFEREHRVSKFDLTLTAVESGEEILLDFEYCSALFKPQTVERFIAYLRRVVAAVIADPGQPLSRIEILSQAEKHQLLVEFNDTAVAYPKDKTIVELFEQQAARTPRAIALVGPAQQLSYQELSERSNQLASLLTEQGVRAGDCVGIYLERSLEAVVAILATLKAGAAYVPLEVDYPSERTGYMLADCRARLVLTRPELAAALAHSLSSIDVSSIDVSSIDVTSFGQATSSGSVPGRSVPAGVSPQSLAYVMYTSGTTGKPKGVLVSHRNVVRLVSKPTYVPLNPSSKLLLTGSLSFDAITFEIWGALLNGGTLHLVDKAVLLDTALLGAALQAYAINTLFLTTALFNHHVDNGLEIFAPLHHLLVGGEKLSPPHINRVRRHFPQLWLVNLYGPTENTTVSLSCHLQAPSYQLIPIGKPIGNSTAYILDQHGQLQPIGAIGELCVGGDGVAGGYLNNEALTAEKFVDNPHKASERIYRTGDMARWLADGTIEFVGRRDEQVKIRGYRVELGEITSRMLSHPQVGQAVVVVSERGNDKQLIAYYCSPAAIGPAEWREALRGLPDYMQPAHLVHLPSMPLSANGKIDRKALPDPELEAGADHVAPVTDTERKLVAIWSQVLGVDPQAISMSSNFFELGGRSLKAVELVSKINKAFGLHISVNKIFRHSTVSELLGLIPQSSDKQETEVIERIADRELYYASSAQERLFFLYLMNPDSLRYNTSMPVWLKRNVNKKKVCDIIQQLIDRHESLRTLFVLKDDCLYEKIQDKVPFQLETIVVENWNQISKVYNNFVRPFDLTKDTLIRCALCEHPKDGDVLFFDVHHIICDGYSLNILISEFERLYNGEGLEPTRIRYVDYAHWAWSNESAIKSQIEYWTKKLSGELPKVRLADGQWRGANTHSASKRSIRLSTDQYNKIKHVMASRQVSGFMLFLSAYFSMVKKMTAISDIIIGTEVLGRSKAELNGVVGTFVNILPLRLQISEESTYDVLIAKTKECVLGAYENQDFQFDDMIAMLSAAGDEVYNSLIQFHLTYYSYRDDEKTKVFEPLDVNDHRDAKAEFELVINVVEEMEQMAVQFIYSKEVYYEETIESMIACFEQVLTNLLNNSQMTLGESWVTYLPEAQTK